MKRFKIGFVFMALALLCGCGKTTFERVEDSLEAGAPMAAGQIILDIPGEFAAPVMEQESSGKLYLWEDYALTVQTMEGGDLDRTIRTCTGFDREALTVMQTRRKNMDLYVCAWTCAGEGSDQVGRLAVLDDGTYHYTVCLMAPADQAEDMGGLWQSMERSLQVSTAP